MPALACHRMLSRGLDQNCTEMWLRSCLTMRLGCTTIVLNLSTGHPQWKCTEAFRSSSPRSGSQRWGMEKMQLLSCPRGGKLSMLLMAMWPAGCTKGWSPYAFRALMLIGPIPVDSPRSLSKWRKLGDPPEKEMATHSSALALRIPGTGEPGWLSHRVGHDWSDLAAAAYMLMEIHNAMNTKGKVPSGSDSTLLLQATWVSGPCSTKSKDINEVYQNLLFTSCHTAQLSCEGHYLQFLTAIHDVFGKVLKIMYLVSFLNRSTDWKMALLLIKKKKTY